MAKNKNRKRNATPLIQENSKASPEPERAESSAEENEVRYRTVIFGKLRLNFAFVVGNKTQ